MTTHLRSDYASRWPRRAACRTADPDLFVLTEGLTDAAYQPALNYCNVCPVTTECLDDALTQPGFAGAVAGVWGGHTPDQIKRLRAEAGIPASQGSRKVPA